MSRLKKIGMVDHTRVFHNECGVFTCTTDGAKFTENEKLRELHIATLKHDLSVVDVFLGMCGNDRVESFMTEREIRKNCDWDHYPDMILRHGKERISLEIELSRKSKNRMENIRNFYLKNMEIDKVVYFVPRELMDYLNSCFDGIDFIETRELI